MVRRRVIVRGLVQGVGFRVSCARRSRAAGVGGWVRNAPDGSVEVVVEGDPAAVNQVIEWCRTGPPASRVDAVGISELGPTGERTFDIR
ncbi:MAG TPA: acylphosphatase [Acidimicrobiales bacterium]|nr:acylphosphatase [Acidimicrobiales bacterium]